MRVHAGLAVALLVLAGCSGLSRPTASDTAAPQAETAAATQTGPLVFADRLLAADRAELARIGAQLRQRLERDPSAPLRLRYALWQATPGHRGVDLGAARRQLERLLIDGADLDRGTRALVRWQLRHLRAVMALRANNARLTQQNERLRAKIRELTQLEQRMGSSGP